MKAMAVDGYGPLERLRQVEVPEGRAGTGEVLVHVVASALNPADYKVIGGSMTFLHAHTSPLVMGYDFSGTVKAVGAKVTRLAVGQDVFGCLAYGPFNRRGAFAESVVVREGEVGVKPPSVSHRAAAAAATAGLTALQGIRTLGRLPHGGRLLVTGVSGGVGSLAVGIGVRLGGEVTAIGSGAGLELARALGASMVWDRTRAEVTRAVTGTFDVVFDAAASYRWRQWRHALTRGGAFVTTLPTAAFFVDKVLSLPTRTRAHMVAVKSTTAALDEVGRWLADGLAAPIDSVIAVRDVAAGLERLRAGRAKGRIVVDVEGGFSGAENDTRGNSWPVGPAIGGSN